MTAPDITKQEPQHYTNALKEPYFSTFQLILLAMLAALIVVAKIALRLPLRTPGHSGLFWMAIIIVSAGIVPKRGATSLIGLTSGFIAAFLGLGDQGALNTFLSYTVVGVSTDLALLLMGGRLDNLLAVSLIAMIGHLGKFVVKWLFGVITGAPIGFVTLGLAWAALGYIIWGGLWWCVGRINPTRT